MDIISADVAVQHNALFLIFGSLIMNISNMKNSDAPITASCHAIPASTKREKPPSIIQSIKLSGLFSNIFMISSYTVAVSSDL